MINVAQIHALQTRLRAVADRVATKASQAKGVLADEYADGLFDHADEVGNIERELREWLGDTIDGMCAQADQSSVNVLNATLAGIKVARENDDA